MAKNGEALERFNQGDDERGKAKALLLMDLQEGYSLAHASRKAGVSRMTVWNWRQADPDFDELYRQARAGGADWYEDKLRGQANKGNTVAIIAGLKMHRRIVTRMEHSGPEGGPIKSIEIPPDPDRAKEVLEALKESHFLDSEDTNAGVSVNGKSG